MRKIAFAILALLLMVPASVHAQLPYQGLPSAGGFGQPPFGGGFGSGYYGNGSIYGRPPQQYPAGLGLLNPNSNAGFAIRATTTYSNTNNIRYNQDVLRNAFQSQGQAPPPGAIEEDLFATLPPAGHYSGYFNTYGYYPLNGRTTTRPSSQSQPQQPAKKTGQ